MSSIKEFQHLKLSLHDLKLATNNFAETNRIGRGGFGKVYKGEILLSDVLTMVAIKRLDRSSEQGTTEFWKEIMMLSQYKHKNLVSLLGFCDEGGERILVYEYLSNRSLDLYLNSADLSLHQRLIICLGAAMGLKYLHEPIEGSHQRVLHRDIKSANILLDHNWNPRITDFGLSRLGPANQEFTFVISNPVGTMGYYDPSYAHTGFLTKESDVYSFGVVLFEVLCGRPCLQSYDDIRRSLTVLARKCYEEKKMDTIIHIGLKDIISPKCLEKFSAIAYQCLELDRVERPTMGEVVEELKCALHYQNIHESPTREVPLKEIQVATKNFTSYIGETLDGVRIYEGELSIFGIPTRVLIMRLGPEHSGFPLSFFLKLVENHSRKTHPNHVLTPGYCVEEREIIIVSEYPERGCLDHYIRRRYRASTPLTWLQRLEICASAGRGLSWLHSHNYCHYRFISRSIFLDDRWVAKIGDLEICTQCLTGFDREFVNINHASYSPEYIINGKETPESNVYSFGIVLFQVLCGRLCTEEVDGYPFSVERIKDLYEKKKLDEIVDPALLREEKMNSSNSMVKYSEIAYQCLLDDPQERPSMHDVVKELEELCYVESLIYNKKET